MRQSAAIRRIAKLFSGITERIYLALSRLKQGSIPLGSASKLRHLGSHQPRSLNKTLVNSGERLRNLLPTLAD
jgi:hypothetical protein